MFELTFTKDQSAMHAAHIGSLFVGLVWFEEGIAQKDKDWSG